MCMSRRLASVILILTTITLSACGGGGSDSGGGGGGPSADFSGTYIGFVSIRRTGPRLTPVTGDFRVGFSVNAAGQIRYGNTSLTGQINGNAFEINNDIDPPQPAFGGDFLCRGPEKLKGTVSGNLIRGNYEGKFECITADGASGRTNLLYAGPFQATRTGTTARAE